MKKMHVIIEFDYEVNDDVTSEMLEETFTERVQHWNVEDISIFAEYYSEDAEDERF